MTDVAVYRLTLALLAAATAILFLLSLTVGPAAIAFAESLRALFSSGNDAVILIMRRFGFRGQFSA